MRVYWALCQSTDLNTQINMSKKISDWAESHWRFLLLKPFSTFSIAWRMRVGYEKRLCAHKARNVWFERSGSKISEICWRNFLKSQMSLKVRKIVVFVAETHVLSAKIERLGRTINMKFFLRFWKQCKQLDMETGVRVAGLRESLEAVVDNVKKKGILRSV